MLYTGILCSLYTVSRSLAPDLSRFHKIISDLHEADRISGACLGCHASSTALCFRLDLPDRKFLFSFSYGSRSMSLRTSRPPQIAVLRSGLTLIFYTWTPLPLPFNSSDSILIIISIAKHLLNYMYLSLLYLDSSYMLHLM